MFPRSIRSIALVGAAALLPALAGCDAGTALGTDPDSPLTLGVSDLALVPGDTARIPAEAATRVQWTTSDPAVATVDANGLVRAVGEGQAEVLALSGGARASARVRVTTPSYRVSVTPDSLTLDVGQSAVLTATVTDRKGAVVAGSRPVWTSSAPALAQVDSMGRVTAAAAGTVLIAATLGGHADTSRVTVRQPAAPVPTTPTTPTAPTTPTPSTGPAELPRVYLDTRAPAVTGRTINVAAGGNLQTALNDAQPGDQVVLQAGATFTGSFTLPKKTGTGWITIRTSGTLPAEGTRVRPADAGQMAKLVTNTTDPVLRTAPGAHHYRIVGLDLGFASTQTIGYTLVALGDGDSRTQNSLSLVPTDIVIDRSYIHGHATVSFQRCVGMNSARTAVIDSWLSDCHGKGMDSQAIAGWNGPGPYKIVNNHLAGAGENVMFGGSDSGIADLVPSDIEFRRNHLYKPLAWRGVWSVKNIFELKNAQRVLIEGNVFENNWQDGQSGVAIVFTPRNQDGGNPWAVVRDVTFRNNVVRRSGSAFSILGYDYNHPSRVTTNIFIENNSVEEINGGVYGGSGMGFLINQERPSNVVVRNNTINNTGMLVLFDGNDSSRKLDRFEFTGNHASVGRIGAGPEGGTGALNFAVASWTVTGNVLAGVAASIYPPNNTYVSTLTGYTGAGGVDRTALNAAIANVVIQP